MLSGQLQQFNQGFTVPQIRSLDKVIKVIEVALKPFTDGLNKILIVESSYANEKEKQENEAKKQNQIQAFINTEGEKKVTCPFEDTDFEFIRMIWSKMSSLSGAKEAREAIIKIDDAIQHATISVFKELN